MELIDNEASFIERMKPKMEKIPMTAYFQQKWKQDKDGVYGRIMVFWLTYHNNPNIETVIGLYYYCVREDDQQIQEKISILLNVYPGHNAEKLNNMRLILSELLEYLNSFNEQDNITKILHSFARNIRSDACSG